MKAPLIWTKGEVEDWIFQTRERYGRPMYPSEIRSWEHNALVQALSFHEQNDCIDEAAIVATMQLIRTVVAECYNVSGFVAMRDE